MNCEHVARDFGAMPLSAAQLQSIQADCMADDLDIDLERMSLWTESQAIAYFESGGSEAPLPALPKLERKPRIGCLHGTASCSRILRMQLSAVLKAMSGECEFVFIEGGREVDPSNPQVQGVRKFFGDGYDYLEYVTASTDERGWRTYPGMDAAVEQLERDIAAAGGCDALIGFSQGANLITALSARAERRRPGALPPLRCVLLLSPTLPGWLEQHELRTASPELFESPLQTPALVIACDGDLVAKGGPGEVAKLYAASQRLRHSGPGHRPLPADRPELEANVERIKGFVHRHC